MNRKRYSSHIGLDYSSKTIRLFTFQLLNEQGTADATVDFTNETIDRTLTTNALLSKHREIEKLANIHRLISLRKKELCLQ